MKGVGFRLSLDFAREIMGLYIPQFFVLDLRLRGVQDIRPGDHGVRAGVLRAHRGFGDHASVNFNYSIMKCVPQKFYLWQNAWQEMLSRRARMRLREHLKRSELFEERRDGFQRGLRIYREHHLRLVAKP